MSVHPHALFVRLANLILVRLSHLCLLLVFSKAFTNNFLLIGTCWLGKCQNPLRYRPLIHQVLMAKLWLILRWLLLLWLLKVVCVVLLSGHLVVR